MSKTATPVLVETDDNVGIVTLNRPEKFNCLSRSVVDGIDAALTRLEADTRIRAILLKANGRHFCTGADLDEVLEARRSADTLRTFIAAGHAMMRRLEASPLPVVAAVHGLSLAGGLELMMCCDVVLAAESAKLGDQHAQYGLIPGWGGTQRLPRLVGLRRALDLMYSARWLGAAEAADWGLVNQVVADDALIETALDYCRQLGLRSPDGIAAMKQLARDGLEGTLDACLRMELDAVVPGLRTANVAEGLAAFQERRDPVFADRAADE